MSVHDGRRARSRQTRREERIAVLSLAAAVVIAPQLLGGIYPWGVLSIAALAAIALTCCVWANRGRLRLRGMLWISVLLVLGWTIVQALPMPCGIVRVIAPDSVQELERVYSLFNRPAPSLCVISRDPGATRLEMVKGLAMVAVFAAASLLVQLGHRRDVLRALAASGAVLAAVSLVHAATVATKVFGVYTPIEIRDQPFIAPLLNLNSLGGALDLCWPTTVAFAIVAREARVRALWLAAATMIATTVLMTRSRGAIGALGLELLVFAVLGLRARRRAEPSRRTPAERIGLGLALAAVIAVSVYGSYSQVAHEFRVGALDKLHLIGIAARVAFDHAAIGIGRGAFSSTYASMLDMGDSGLRRFDYPENFVVQWCAEWGIPVSLVLLGALGIAMFGAVRRASSWERVAVVTGLLGLAAQNLVDLGSELVAVAVMTATALACAVCERADAAPRRPAPLRSWLFGLAAATAVTAACLGPGLVREYPAAVDERLRAALAAKSHDAFRAHLEAGMRAHPSEPSFALLAAHEALRRRDPAAGRWVNRALQLAPDWAGPHQQAAIWLWNSGHRKQALIELAVAARADIYGTREFACQVASRWPQGLIHAAGKTGRPVMFLELAAACDLTEAQRVEIDLGILTYDPNAPGALVRQAERALLRGQMDVALSLAQKVIRDQGPSLAASRVEATALVELGRPQEAVAALERAIRALPQSAELVQRQLQVMIALKDRAGITRALAGLRGRARDAHELAIALHMEATAETALGNRGAAVRALQQAYDLAREPASLRALAAAARAMGDDARARRAYSELCAISPSDTDSCARAKPPPTH